METSAAVKYRNGEGGILKSRGYVPSWPLPPSWHVFALRDSVPSFPVHTGLGSAILAPTPTKIRMTSIHRNPDGQNGEDIR